MKKGFFIEGHNLGDGMKRIAIAIIALFALSSAYPDNGLYFDIFGDNLNDDEYFKLFDSIPVAP